MLKMKDVSITGNASEREDEGMHLGKHIPPFNPDCFLPHKRVTRMNGPFWPSEHIFGYTSMS